MSIIINVPFLKKPKKCLDCPFLQHIEEDYDHFDFYICPLEYWKQSITKTPMSLNDIYGGVLDSCPIGDYPIKPKKETDEFELIEDYYNE